MASLQTEIADDRAWHQVLIRLVRFRAWLLGGVFTAGAIAIVVRDDGQIMLVKPRYRAGWGLPGGFIKHKEQPLEALRREVQEEVGLSVATVDAVAVYPQPHRRHIDYLFVVRVERRPPARATAWTELSAAAWFELDELPHLQPEAQLALEHYELWSH